MEYLFLVGSNILPLMVVQQLVVILGPAHQNKTQFPPQSLYAIRKHTEAYYVIHQRADRLKTTVTES